MAIAAPADDPGEEDLQAAEDTRAGSDVERAVSDRAPTPAGISCRGERPGASTRRRSGPSRGKRKPNNRDTRATSRIPPNPFRPTFHAADPQTIDSMSPDQSSGRLCRLYITWFENVPPGVARQAVLTVGIASPGTRSPDVAQSRWPACSILLPGFLYGPILPPGCIRIAEKAGNALGANRTVLLDGPASRGQSCERIGAGFGVDTVIGSDTIRAP